MDRQDFADAIVTYAKHRDSLNVLSKRLQAGAVADLSNESTYQSNSERYDVENLESSAIPVYLMIVAKRDGEAEAVKLANDIARVSDPAGVTIIVENSNDDPTMITVHFYDEIASDWCNRHGSLAGSTWESPDGDDFAYDSFHWHPGIFDELQKEGYVFDFSQYSEPDERDIAIAIHGSECGECEYDWYKAEKHMIALGKLPKSFDLKRANGEFFGRYEGFTADEALTAAKASEWNRWRDFDGVTATEVEP